MENLLPRHLVRHDDNHLVAALGRNQRQTEAGIARRCLDQRAAGLQLAAGLSRLDHGNGDTVLDRAAGILVFQLQEQPAWSGIEIGHLQHRGVTDHVERG